MTGIELRDARDGDCPALCAIVNPEIATGLSIWHEIERSEADMRDWLDQRRAAGMAVIVAERQGAILGYAGYGPFRPHSGYALTVEHSLYVDAAHRGQGIGNRLLDALIHHARQAGRHVMIGGIEAGNTASIALHRRHGFAETARLPEVGRKFGRWLTLVLMQRPLT